MSWAKLVLPMASPNTVWRRRCKEVCVDCPRGAVPPACPRAICLAPSFSAPACWSPWAAWLRHSCQLHTWAPDPNPSKHQACCALVEKGLGLESPGGWDAPPGEGSGGSVPMVDKVFHCSLVMAVLGGGRLLETESGETKPQGAGTSLHLCGAWCLHPARVERDEGRAGSGGSGIGVWAGLGLRAGPPGARGGAGQCAGSGDRCDARRRTDHLCVGVAGDTSAPPVGGDSGHSPFVCRQRIHFSFIRGHAVLSSHHAWAPCLPRSSPQPFPFGSGPLFAVRPSWAWLDVEVHPPGRATARVSPVTGQCPGVGSRMAYSGGPSRAPSLHGAHSLWGNRDENGRGGPRGVPGGREGGHRGLVDDGLAREGRHGSGEGGFAELRGQEEGWGSGADPACGRDLQYTGTGTWWVPQASFSSPGHALSGQFPLLSDGTSLPSTG